MTNRKKFLVPGLVFLILVLWQILRPSRTSGPETIRPRADVVAWINKHFAPNHRKVVAMTRMAESQQFKLFYPTSMTMKIERAEAHALSCYMIAFGEERREMNGLQPYDAVAAETFNTYARARKEMAYRHALSGGVYGDFEIESWDEQCEKPLSL